MDGREGIASFYLNGGFHGSGSNIRSDNNGGGFQNPPPGFKTQSNPNLIDPDHTNMRLEPSIGSAFHMEHNPPPPPPPNFPRGFNMDGGDGGGGGGGEGERDEGGGAASVPTKSGNDSAEKKRRGRPKKQLPDGSHMALALAPAVATPDPTTPASQKKRGRPCGSGRKQQLANAGEWMHTSAGSAFTPHIIHISAGEDVAEKVLLFAQQRQRALCVLSGNGSVSTVTLRQFTASGGTVTYEDRFEILCLSGCYLLADSGGPRGRAGGLSISVCNADGKVIGGAIGGKLIASTLVQVVVGSFVYGGGDGFKAKNTVEPPSANEKSPEVELN